ncbi:MAG: hypothetical protein ACRDJ2_06115 [Actinomycetota bacterium]
MITARDKALAFLNKQVEWVSTFRKSHGENAWPERDGRIRGCLRVFEATGVLSAAEVEQWRVWIAAGEAPRPEASNETQQAGDDLLRDLLEAVPPDGDGIGSELSRFEGALGALIAVGAVDGAAWSNRLNAHMGWPSDEEEQEQLRQLNAGGSEEELLAVYAGPGPTDDGVRVLYVLAFRDGVSIYVHRRDEVEFDDDDAWWDAELADDLGTRYAPGGTGGGDGEQHFGFRTPIPEGATWIEVRGLSKDRIRVQLR